MELKFAKRFDKSYEKGGVEEKEKGVPFQDDTTNAKANDNGDTKKKRMTLKQLAAKNTKMTDWIRRQDNIGELKEKERVDDEEDWPEMDQPEDIIRKETAKAKSMAFKIGHMCRGIVEELVDGVSSNSAAGMILESVLRRSWWRIRLTEVRRLLEDDRNLQKAILKKIERHEKDDDYLLEVVEKEDRLERKKVARERWVKDNEKRQLYNLEEMMASLSMYSEELVSTDDLVRTEEMEWSLLEVEEHNFIEERMNELGITEVSIINVEMIDFDEEMGYLENILEGLRYDVVNGDDGKVEGVGWMEEGGHGLKYVVDVHDICLDFSTGIVGNSRRESELFLTWSMGSDEFDDIDRSPEIGDLSMCNGTCDPPMKDSLNLLLFSIVGRPGGSRKRPLGRRAGRWWTARGWLPMSRRTAPWRVGRRRSPVCTTSDNLRQDMVQMNTVEIGMMNELMPVSAGYAENDNYFPGVELSNKVQVDKVGAMMSGQKELLPKGAGETVMESDKIELRNGYWAQAVSS